jgi:palmitoyltransferase
LLMAKSPSWSVMEPPCADFRTHWHVAHSAQVLALVVLYVWCVASDPADPGVHQSRQAAEAKRERKVLKACTSSDVGLEQSQDGSDGSIPSTFPLKNEGTNVGKSICFSSGGCLHNLVCKKPQETEKFNTGEQLLYCSICDAEVSNSLTHSRCHT